MRRIKGGYEPIRLCELNSVLILRKQKLLSASALRVWLAAREMKARRCQANGKTSYGTSELIELTGLSLRKVQSSIHELERYGLMSMSETKLKFGHSEGKEFEQKVSKRLLPFPRRLLRVLAQHEKPAELVAILAHLGRLLWLKKHEVKGVGFVRSSWLVDAYGVSRRSVMNARKWLVRSGIVTIRKVNQFILNRHGQCFEVCLEERSGSGIAPPDTKNGIDSAPPIYNQELLRSTRNQEPSSGPNREAPRIQNVVYRDLRSISRLRSLYHQAVTRGWVNDSENDFLNFVSASIRAVRANGDSVRIFVAIVRKRLWTHITQDEENYARRTLKRQESASLNLQALGVSID